MTDSQQQALKSTLVPSKVPRADRSQSTMSGDLSPQGSPTFAIKVVKQDRGNATRTMCSMGGVGHVGHSQSSRQVNEVLVPARLNPRLAQAWLIQNCALYSGRHPECRIKDSCSLSSSIFFTEPPEWEVVSRCPKQRSQPLSTSLIAVP